MGGPYIAHDYQALPQTHGFQAILSRVGNGYDNAVAESAFSKLRNELTCHQPFRHRDAARAAIVDTIGVIYNRQRRRQSLGYRSPVQFEMMAAVV